MRKNQSYTSLKSLALLMATLLAIVLLAGCGGAASSAAASSAVESTANTSQATEQEGTHSVTDMAGRVLELPVEITKVFPTQPVSAIYMYTLAPDRLLGWNYELNELERSYILEEYQDLPVFGMNDSVNYEAVIAAAPEMALAVSALNDAAIAEADALSDRLGIPVVIVSSELKDTAAVYRLLGEILGVSEEAENLAAYVDETMRDLSAVEIAEEDRIRVYFGNGDISLETAPVGSTHAQALDLVQAVNVADVAVESGGRVQVSLEQVITWNPEVILVNGNPKADITGNAAAQEILENPDWASVAAVQSSRVYGVPKAPFSWVDRPPGPNRIIGLRWLANLLYPEVFNYDIGQEISEFYSLFYHTNLSEEQLQQLMES